MAELSKTLDVVQELIETCRDGEIGYAHAASVVSDPELKSYFTQQSQERHRLIGELQEVVQRIGEPTPEASGSVAGTLHRAWFEAKVDMGLGDQAVLESVERGEDAAKAAYQKALASDLDENVLMIVERQSENVFEAHDEVRYLRNRGRAA